jgi:exonuclease SbcC
MIDRLTSLAVRDFRSIRGPISVSLDAPAVLIHGPNGTGKTSLLSAIELGLTGAVASLARFDPDLLAYLPHKLGAGPTEINIAAGTRNGDAQADGKAITGKPLLDPEEVRFYVERCYLAQATLGRLLEIYEHQDNRRTDSPLTRFVKEMLGLEALDALIDGLHAAGNVTRFRTIAPNFWEARDEAAALSQAVRTAQDAVTAVIAEQAAAESAVRELADPSLAVGEAIEPAGLRRALEQRKDEEIARLAELAAIRRDVEAAGSQVAAAVQADAGGVQATAEARSAQARQQLGHWQSGPGAALLTLLTAIQAMFPDIPAASSDPAVAHEAALRLVTTAHDRGQKLLAADGTTATLLEETRVALVQGQGRLATIDRELTGAGGANRKLAEALGSISAHIEEEHCPVCGRDYSEMEDGPLAAHVSAEIARLVTAAGRVETLVKERTTTATAVAVAERRKSDLQAQLLDDDRRDTLKLEHTRLGEWLISLEASQTDAQMGSRLIREATQAAEQLSLLSNRSASLAGLRAQLAGYAVRLGELPSDHDVPLRGVLEALSSAIVSAEAERLAASTTLDQALRTLTIFVEAGTRRTRAESDLTQAKATETDASRRRTESERRIGIARDMLGRAQAVRGQQVQRIFNEELNSVWRELFIRLAPDEAFVPAFAVPQVAGRPVEAVLETLYRAGGKGGNPRGMLSAGNLNTAALTLFLALHLSVPARVPWLIIDDPVQSMDDVHIAQLAALLRTLKHKGRQVIIAVHDRQLFDYLALELSPAFNGDRLVTIQLGRDAEGFTTAPWELTGFEIDKAIAA